MAYNQGVPATGSSGSQDYLAIQGNFQQLQTTFSVNHEPIASGGGIDGYHKLVQMPVVQASDPNLPAPQTSLYTKTVSGTSELFFQNGSTAADVTQLTGANSPTSNEFRSGLIAISNPAGTPISFTPFPNACTAVVITGQNATYFPRVISINSGPANGFVAGTSGLPISAYYIAIGN